MPSLVPETIVWLRRDLRLEDHAALAHACALGEPVQPVFVFDSDILGKFPNPSDRRVTFIANALLDIDRRLKQIGGRMLVLHGRAQQVVPALAEALGGSRVVAAEDYEPGARARDAVVSKALGDRMIWVKDQLIFAPDEVSRGDDAPYRVYTPFSRAWLAKLTPAGYLPHEIPPDIRYANSSQIATAAGLKVLSVDGGASRLLHEVGYELVEDDLWQPTRAQDVLSSFIADKAEGYDECRDLLAVEGTSRLSPYLRFGLVSVRQCVREAMRVSATKWLSELIWREFYASILFHYPESENLEFDPRYRGGLDWSDNEEHLAAWKAGRTGYPVVDAAMRQLLWEGWMHNRARMVVASFLTKHLRIDWREGEQHFAQLLMDYDMASNVGGWQWAASTGTDAQPYFRVFNPTIQSKKYDPNGDYIRRYVPELKDIPAPNIHEPKLATYTPPIVRHKDARAAAIAMYRLGPA